MKVPSASDEIRKPWVEYILTDYERRTKPNTKVHVKSFEVCNATKPGESFNASLLKLTVDAFFENSSEGDDGEGGEGGGSDGGGGDGGGGGGDVDVSTKTDKTYHLIVKFLSTDPFNREMVKLMEYHIRELVMYSEVLQNLNKYQEQHANNEFPIEIPEFIYGKCTNKEYVLVMENLKNAGYETNPKENGLDYHQLMHAMEQIGRYHALSYVYNKEKSLLDAYPSLKFNPSISSLFKVFVNVSLDTVLKFLRTKEEHKDLLKKLEVGKGNIPRQFQALWDDHSKYKMKCLSHGDFWNSNLMYKYSEVTQDGIRKIDGVKLIDFQICQWTNPVFDLHYVISTSTTPELRKAHLDDVLRHYHETFTNVTKRLDSPVPDYSYEEFREEYDKSALVGLIMGICLIQGTLSKTGERMLQTNDPVCNKAGCLPFKASSDFFKSGVAKVITPLALHPSFRFIITVVFRKMFGPVADELISGTNQIMNKRLIGLLVEANENGVIDKYLS
ncbi:uncharacterized protein LOC143024709 isoform X2 [Oratosquilla oratoria]